MSSSRRPLNFPIPTNSTFSCHLRHLDYDLSRTESGCYRLLNDSNGQALTLKADSPASLQAAGNEENQQLMLQEVLTL